MNCIPSIFRCCFQPDAESEKEILQQRISTIKQRCGMTRRTLALSTQQLGYGAMTPSGNNSNANSAKQSQSNSPKNSPRNHLKGENEGYYSFPSHNFHQELSTSLKSLSGSLNPDTTLQEEGEKQPLLSQRTTSIEPISTDDFKVLDIQSPELEFSSACEVIASLIDPSQKDSIAANLIRGVSPYNFILLKDKTLRMSQTRNFGTSKPGINLTEDEITVIKNQLYTIALSAEKNYQQAINFANKIELR